METASSHLLAVIDPKSWKGKKSGAFRKLCKQFKPHIILQHPHTTDTPNIWNLAWRTVEKKLPQVQHFASGIKYYYKNGHPRGDLDRVLAKTKKGDVIDFIFEQRKNSTATELSGGPNRVSDQSSQTMFETKSPNVKGYFS